MAERARDPYRHFRFRMRWGARTVAGFSRVQVPPDGTRQPFTLEGGCTYDAGFEAWASSPSLQGQDASPVRNVAVDQVDETGKVVSTYEVLRSWVSELQAQPDLDAGANAVAIQHLKLENEGWRLHHLDAHPPSGQRLV